MERSKGLSVGKLMVVVAFAAMPMAFCLAPIYRQSEFVRLQWSVDAVIRNLQPTDPASVTPAVWDCVRGATITAYDNVCVGPEHVSITEMIRLREDLDRKLKGKVDLDTLVWIWERLGQTGPTGKDYATRFRPLLDHCVPARP